MSITALSVMFFFLALLLVLFVFVVVRRDAEDLNFYSEGKVVLVSAVISVGVIFLFLFFRENAIYVPDGLGQIGDFIGGLTNPILSFVVLVILLRSTSIQTKIYKRETFQSELHSLLDNVQRSAKMHAKKKYVNGLVERHRIGRVEIQGLPDADREIEAKKIVVESIERQSFEQFALSVRMAILHVRESDLSDILKDNYIVMIRGLLTRDQRIVLLNWAYYYWKDAKKWMQIYPFARGLSREEFISDEVYKFFTKLRVS